MKIILTFFFAILLANSCKPSNSELLYGTWKHSEIREQKNDYDIMNIQEGTSSETIYTETDLKQSKTATTVQDFYLVFDNETNYIEYKVGMGMKFGFKLSNDTIYSNGEPEFKIVSVTNKVLNLKKLKTGKPVNYIKSNDDLSKFEILN
ncbi:hypothetical protein [Cellulophaga sp. L1A9]|uniref:hypothetical protein n=1 Tax=Cellulophaga sp. L1A9 TaxID=2686362 RepID=UPI00131B5656|nr:hypothetical protein [Cellulophaga sp. L1A9]